MRNYHTMKPIKIQKLKPHEGSIIGSLINDKDGDGLPNKLDCEPFNSKKQGILHKAGAYIARKTGNEEKAKRFEEAGEQRDQEKKEDKERLNEAREDARQEKRENRVSYREERIRTAPQRSIERRETIKKKVGEVVVSAGKQMNSKNSKGQKFVGNAQSNTDSIFGMGNGGIMGNNQNNRDNYGSGMNFGGMDIMNPGGKPKPIKKKGKKSKRSKPKQKVKVIYRTKPKKKNNYVIMNGQRYYKK